MADNQPTQPPNRLGTPEFHTPPPPPGEPPATSATATQRPDEHATQQSEVPHQPPASSVLAAAQASAPEPPVQPSADPFDDTQRTAAPAQPGQLAEPPQHPDRPLPLGGVTDTPLHSEPAPILPPRPQPQPQVQPESQIAPPPRASFDQPIPDHPAMRQQSTGRSYSPTPMQRVALTPVAPQPVAPPPQAPVLAANAETLESDPAIASLHAMFPAFDLMVLQSVLEATGGDKDQAVDSLLSMSDPDYAPSHQQATTGGGGAPNQGRQPTQTELDEEFARRLMLEEEEQARGGTWPPRDQQTSPFSHSVPYQQYQPRRSGEYQRPSGEYQRPTSGAAGTGGGIGEIAGDLQQQFRSFIGGAGGGSARRGTGTQSQGPGAGGAGYQDQFNKIADTGKKTFNSIFSKVKQKMEEFDNRNPPDTQYMNQPPQSGHWSNWQGPPAQQQAQGQNQQQQVPTFASSPPPSQQYAPPSHPPPSTTQHGALNNNPYRIPEEPPQTQANTAGLPTSSGRWQYQPEESGAPASTTAPALAPPSAGATGAEEPRRSVDATRLGLLPKRPVSLMDVNANTRPAQPPAATHERDSDEESLEYVDRPMPGSMARP